jgi:hypothetical protein
MPPPSSGALPFSTINHYLNNYRRESLKPYTTSITFFVDYLMTLFEPHRLLHIEWYEATAVCESCEIIHSTKYRYVDSFDPSRNIYLQNAFLFFVFICLRIIWQADHSGRAFWGMNCLRSLEHWDRGFESHLRHEYLCAFDLCLCCSVCR